MREHIHEVWAVNPRDETRQALLFRTSQAAWEYAQGSTNAVTRLPVLTEAQARVLAAAERLHAQRDEGAELGAWLEAWAEFQSAMEALTHKEAT